LSIPESQLSSEEQAHAIESYTSRQSRSSALFSLPVILTLVIFEVRSIDLEGILYVTGLVASMLFRIGLLWRLRPSRFYSTGVSTIFVVSAAFWGLWLAHSSAVQSPNELPIYSLVLAGVGLSGVVTLALHPSLLVSFLVTLFTSFILYLSHHKALDGLAPLLMVFGVFIVFAFSQSGVIKNLLLKSQRSNLLMEQIIDAFPGYVALIDTQKKYRFVGSSVARLASKPRQEIVGTLVGFWGIDRTFSERLEVFFEGQLPGFQFEHVINNRHHLVQFRRLSTNDVLAVSLDIHDVVQARQLHLDEQRIRQHGQQLQMLGQLAAGIAHEINNPLAIAIGACESAQRQLGKVEPNMELVRTRLETIFVASERAAKIVRSMRLLSRDPEHSELSDQSLKDMIVDVLALCESKLKVQGIDFRYEWNLEERDVVITAHPVYFTQIILNLIWNARDATLHEESLQKKIALVVQKLGSKIRLSVENTGPMIPAEVQGKIMTPFFTTKSTGTGMGLSLSKSWADAMGAELSFKSEAHKTQFHLDITDVRGVPTQG
jgi:signal transduction histidine kinase